jgi:hypothetical protein
LAKATDRRSDGRDDDAFHLNSPAGFRRRARLAMGRLQILNPVT